MNSICTAYVKSNTVVGDSKHTTGVVLAEIVVGNIPVKNGVVHLIHRPLMVVDTTVAKFLEVCRKSDVFFIVKLFFSFYIYLSSLGKKLFLQKDNFLLNQKDFRSLTDVKL